MEIKLKKDDIELILKEKFGNEVAILAFDKDGIEIDVTIESFISLSSKSVSKSSSGTYVKGAVEYTKAPNEQVLTPEQERAIRLEMARYGGVDREDSTPVMQNKRTISKEPSKKANVIIDRNARSIIDGAN